MFSKALKIHRRSEAVIDLLQNADKDTPCIPSAKQRQRRHRAEYDIPFSLDITGSHTTEILQVYAVCQGPFPRI